MSLKTCVSQLYDINSTYLHPEHAVNQALSLKALSNDLYSDPMRFIYELIQNADDAKSPTIQISLVAKKFLAISHKGKAFDEMDVRGVCSIGHSMKTRCLNSTGYKGLGFKSVFVRSQYVVVISNGECFRFDSDHPFKWQWPNIDRLTWERTYRRKFKFPWHICPIWTKKNELPSSLSSWLRSNADTYTVITILRLNNPYEMSATLKELTDQPNMLIFLRHIQDIDIIIDSNAPCNIRQEKQRNKSVKLYCNNKFLSQWLVVHRNIRITSEKISEDIHLPEKLRGVKMTAIGLAAKLDIQHGKRIIPIDEKENFLFAYIPTKISAYRFSLIVNGNFITNANREQIHADSPWNQTLFEAIPHEIIKWISELHDDKEWTNAAYDLIPVAIQPIDQLALKYNESCKIALKKYRFIKTRRNEYVTAEEAIIDQTDLSEQQWIPDQYIKDLIIKKNLDSSRELSSYRFVTDDNRFCKIKLKTFQWEDAVELFDTTQFQRMFSIQQCVELIQFVYNHKTDEEIKKYLYHLPFILDEKKRLQTVTKIYFPSPFNNSCWGCTDSSDAYIHRNLLLLLSDQYKIWLTTLGVVEKTDLSFFHRTIVPNAYNFITLDNAQSTIQQLFLLYMNGKLLVNDLKKLNRLGLLTLNNSIMPADQLYLSTTYNPRLPLNHILTAQPHRFLSACYYQQNHDVRDWYHFFRVLGVQDTIDYTTLSPDIGLFNRYRSAQTAIIYGIGSQSIHRFQNRITINFLEETENNFNFAVDFWQYVMRRLDANRLIESEIAYWGNPGKRGSIHGSQVNSYPRWFIRERPCIPVKLLSSDSTTKEQCFKAIDVYNGCLYPMIGQFLPIFVYNDEMNGDWEKFFGFKSELTIDDHFNLLNQIYLFCRDQLECDRENQDRIQNIYSDLLNRHLPRLNPDQIRIYRDRWESTRICLLSDPSKHFIAPEQLYMWSVKEFPCPVEINTLTVDQRNRDHTSLPKLLQIFAVQQIEATHIETRPTGTKPIIDLKDQIRHEYFSCWLQSKGVKDDVIVALQSLNFIEAERIEFCMKETAIHVSFKNIHCDLEQKRLWIQQPWRNNSQDLSMILCRLLELPMDAYHTPINQFLSASTVEGWWYQIDLPVEIDTQLTLMGAPRDQFAKSINEANKNLFDKIGYPNVAKEPLELLIDGLNAQDSCWKGYIYHYTHLENAVSILCQGKLKSRYQANHSEFKDCAARSVIEQTHAEVMKFARFSFRPLTPSQYCVEHLGHERTEKQYGNIPMCPVPVFFRIKLDAIRNLSNLEWAVSLASMASPHSEFGSTSEVVEKFDFHGVFLDPRTSRGKLSSQQEFLIKDQLDLHQLPQNSITIICTDPHALSSLKSMLSETFQRPSMQIDPLYFFRTNPRIDIKVDAENQYLTVILHDPDEWRSNHILVVQMDSINGGSMASSENTICMFHNDHRITIYGKKRIKVNFDQSSFMSVYYFNDQLERWLIHTNHPKPQYDSTHEDEYREMVSNILDEDIEN